MNDYYEVDFKISPSSEDASDYLAALLGEIGFESFVPYADGLKAYIKYSEYSESRIKSLLSEDFIFECEASYTPVFIAGQDWNAEWEKNYFKPIVVADQCVIHSSFHTDIPTAKYDIVIDPKMAFGTGHHATTSLTINRLLQLDLKDKSVIDMGTGTGILAILSAMRGASPVFGVEIDAFAYDNAIDNVRLNDHDEITLINGDASALNTLPEVDIFIANINRNVILEDMHSYVSKLKQGGTMILSGFYESDIPTVAECASGLGLSVVTHDVLGDNWTCLVLARDAKSA